jgi:lipopolysaccharide export LptBFGC system permease protein LptF
VILQRYILRELISTFLFAFSAVLAICLVGSMFEVFRVFPNFGFTIMAKMLPLALGTMSSWVMLIASCTAGTLVYARLAADNEITAMRTCGIHIGRIVAPGLLLGLLLTAAAYPINEFVIPPARHHRRVSVQQSPFLFLRLPPPGKQDFRIGSARLCYTDFRDGRMEKPVLMKFKDDKLVMQWFAPSGTILAEDRPIRVVMSKPRYRQIDAQGHEELFSAESDMSIPLEPEETPKGEWPLTEQPADILWSKVLASNDPAFRNPILLQLHTRYAQSLAPLLLILVSVPIGILVRRGSRLAGLGAAVPPLMVYVVAFFIFQGLGSDNRANPLLAAYAPDLILGVPMLFLLKGVSHG